MTRDQVDATWREPKSLVLVRENRHQKLPSRCADQPEVPGARARTLPPSTFGAPLTSGGSMKDVRIRDTVLGLPPRGRSSTPTVMGVLSRRA